MNEAEFIAALRRFPLHPGARGLADDAAVVGGLVMTADTLVEGVHFLPADPAEDVAWKLVATNLSDLAAKGAEAEGVLLSYPLRDAEWDARFLTGLAEVLAAFSCPLIGGDTVSLPAGAPRVLALTAIGRDAAAPPRGGARAGDTVWVTGTVGDAGAGLAIARGAPGAASLLAAYRRPQPRLAEGRALAPHVHAMTDVSDGLLIDAARIAAASGVAIEIELDRIPLSPELRAFGTTPLTAAISGDDYELLFAAAPEFAPPVHATAIGRVGTGAELTLLDRGQPVRLPVTLGFTHG